MSDMAIHSLRNRIASLIGWVQQPVHGQLRLLLDGLDRNEAHVRPPRSFANWRVVVGALPALAVHAVGTDEVARDQPGIKAHLRKLSRPVVDAAAGFQLGTRRQDV